MKVKCINDSGNGLLAVDITAGNLRSSVFHITLDREYAVYGILFSGQVMSFLIQADTGFPQWTPASLFHVVCDRVSRFWVLASRPFINKYFAAIGFPELMQSWESFDQLTLGDDSARANFFKRKQLADLEFVDSSVERTAEALDNNWLQCPFCSDAWELNSLGAMVRCPKCEKVSRNPNYHEK